MTGQAASGSLPTSRMGIPRTQSPAYHSDHRLLIGAVLFLCAAALLIVSGDSWISHATQIWQTPGTLLAWERAAWLGNWVIPASLLGVATGVGYLLRRPSLRAASLWGLYACCLSGLFTTLLKHTSCRTRPFLPEAGDFHPLFCLQDGMDSFPSGHASLAFALAVMLGAVYPPLRLPFYFLAATVGLSRVVLGVHYPSDVLAGAAIGLLSGVLCRQHLRRLAAAWQMQREGDCGTRVRADDPMPRGIPGWI